MTTAPFRERITFGGYDFSSYATLVPNLSGWDDLPGLRGENPALTGLPGRQFLEKLFDSRKPAIGLIVTPKTAAGAAAVGTQPAANRIQARANLDALYQVLAQRGQQALVRRMPDATNRTAMAEVLGTGQFQDLAGEVFALMATFDLADPLFYGDPVTPSALAINATTKTFSITNPGSAPRVRRISFDVTGPCTNVRIVNDTTGAFLYLPVAIAGTKHALVDCYAFSATNDGVDINGLVQHAGNTRAFMELAPGVNNFTLTCSVAGGSLSYQWRAGWL